MTTGSYVEILFVLTSNSYGYYASKLTCYEHHIIEILNINCQSKIIQSLEFNSKHGKRNATGYVDLSNKLENMKFMTCLRSKNGAYLASGATK